MKKKHILKTKYEKWIVNSKLKGQNSKLGVDEIIKVLLENRRIRTKKEREEFFDPTPPEKIELKESGIDEKSIKKGIKRILKAKKSREKVIIFGDYDADGITSSAILWEYLYGLGMDVIPYIPERFSEGYGIKIESIAKLKEKYPKLSLIITVDNGIVAFDAVEKANKLGIDIIIVDHHEKGEKYPKAYSVIHTTKLCGAGIAWIFIRELSKTIRDTGYVIRDTLELAALGTVADQMPLVGVNRSFVKYGLDKLNNTRRIGLNALLDVSGVHKGDIGVYEINYMIAPRLNAMGRLEHAIDSLRLLCTKNRQRAFELAELLNRTNLRRQKVVDEVVIRAKDVVTKNKLERIIILEDESYHEGVIGLAASKLVDEFWRPAIVISKGAEISKGSARSISGFNIINAIRSAPGFILAGGGHEMAAGFSINTEDIPAFKKEMQKYAAEMIGDDILEKKIKIDLGIKFRVLSQLLVNKIKDMEPFGIGNPAPTFVTQNCEVEEVRRVGRSGNHLKFKLRSDGILFDAISFNNINDISDLVPGMKINVAYNLEENYWNGIITLQLKVKDVRVAES